MIFTICGESASGKDSVFKRLSNHPSLQSIVTTTSRPMRKGEKQNVDYHFITEEEFLTSIDNKEFLEWTTFQTVTNTWFYGTKLEEFKDNGKHKVIVVNPQGLSALISKFGNRNVVGIVIHRDIKDRAISYLQRDKNADYYEMVRRFEKDAIDFDKLKRSNLSNVYHIENKTGEFDKCVSKIERIIGEYI